eukprot:2877925-Alexandrium_andersonii.AAC.1
MTACPRQHPPSGEGRRGRLIVLPLPARWCGAHWATKWLERRLRRLPLRREAEHRKAPIPMTVTFWTAVLAA